MPASAPQLEQLRAAECAQIYREKVTGARPDRQELSRLLRAIGPGDVVTVTRIDRLARSTFDLFAIVKQIVDAKAQFRSLAEPWADTGTKHGVPDDCRSRRAGGRGARSYPLGRPPKLTPQQQKEHGGGGLKGPRSRNWQRATMSAGRRFRDWQKRSDGTLCRRDGHV
jgi:hypothetical protein